jgi:RnfABCDGE-type electron transport complex D subunit
MNGVVSAPHAHAARPVGRVMALVMLALAPATAAGFWRFGYPAIYLWCVTVLACVFAEAVCVRLADRPARPVLMDGSAVLTGWLLALSLPPWAPWWIAAAGGAFAIVVVKQAFGGLGQNPFNPAMAARVMLLISFPVEMTQWLAPHAAGFGAGDALAALAVTFGSGVPDALSGATLLGHVKSEAVRGIAAPQALAEQWAPLAAGFGARAGSLGETGALLLAAGGVFLVLQRVISLRIPAAFLAGVAAPAALAHFVAPDQHLPALVHVLSGGVMLAAFFIATDYTTSPATPLGQWVFGLGGGLLTWVIRSWGAYPEGVAFAVLLMNAAVPLIERVTRPRIFGRGRDGRALAATPGGKTR